MALAMETPMLPAGRRSRSRGGVGYYNHRTRGHRVLRGEDRHQCPPSRRGVGIGFDSGEVGARAGFQHAW